MKWYFPAWNGDVRIESLGEQTRITVISPTELEKTQLEGLHKTFRKKGWTEANTLWETNRAGYRDTTRQETLLSAKLEKVAPIVTKALKAGKQTLSALVLKNGQVETVHGDETTALATRADEGKAAATVKRHTPSCPQCIPGSIEPAREVLLEFLDEDQHKQWAKERAITVFGGMTGQAYLIAHRHSEIAVAQGRICYAIDDEGVVHFHDWTVPPEEEVLAAKLILEHREPWLRNEATMFATNADRSTVFKNPFGDFFDGVADASMTQSIGTMVKRLGRPS